MGREWPGREKEGRREPSGSFVYAGNRPVRMDLYK